MIRFILENWRNLAIVFGVLLILFWCMWTISIANSDESERTLDTHRRLGTHRVLYEDGEVSQPFSKRTARQYAKHFGGKVIPK